MSQSLNFRYGRLGADRVWIANTDSHYFQVDNRTLDALIDCQDGRADDPEKNLTALSEDENENLKKFIDRSGLRSPDGIPHIEQSHQYTEPISLNGIYFFLSLTILIQAIYWWGMAKNFALHHFSQVPTVFCLAVLGIALHEVAHYMTLRPYVKPKFGFTWFLAMPVIYVKSDVLWMLHPTRRILVNLAGIFSDCVFNASAIFCTILNPALEPWVTPLLMTQYMRLLLVINPFLANDGYWLLQDLTGMVNLNVQAKMAYQEKRYGAFFGFRIAQMIFNVVIILSLSLLFYHLIMRLIHR